MAALNFTSQERKEVLRLVILLNGSLQFIVARLEELTSAKILSPKYLTEIKELTQKVQIGVEALMEPKPKK